MSSARRSTKQVRQDREHGRDNPTQQEERDRLARHSTDVLVRAMIDAIVNRWDSGEIDNYEMAISLAVVLKPILVREWAVR